MLDLGSVVPANKNYVPQRILISGVQGLGKTTLGASFEAPILIRTEDGGGAVDAATFPKLISHYEQVEQAIHALHGAHDYKTVVIDTLDWLEPIVWEKTCLEHGEANIESFGYGKGYAHADVQWRNLMEGLDSLRYHKKMDVVLIAHTEVRRYENPETEPYDRYQIKLHRRASALWQEWADVVLFCNHQIRTLKDKAGFGKETTRGTGSGDRVIYTEERPAYLAKNRWGLPHEIHIGRDKSWSAFHIALNEATHGQYKIPSKIQAATAKTPTTKKGK